MSWEHQILKFAVNSAGFHHLRKQPDYCSLKGSMHWCTATFMIPDLIDPLVYRDLLKWNTQQQHTGCNIYCYFLTRLETISQKPYQGPTHLPKSQAEGSCWVLVFQAHSTALWQIKTQRERGGGGALTRSQPTYSPSSLSPSNVEYAVRVSSTSLKHSAVGGKTKLKPVSTPF